MIRRKEKVVKLVRIPSAMRPYLMRLAAAGLLGQTEDEVVIYLLRDSLHHIFFTEWQELNK